MWALAFLAIGFINFVRSTCNEYKTMQWCDTTPYFLESLSLASKNEPHTCLAIVPDKGVKQSQQGQKCV
jgi:hypothetical protein